MGEDGVKNRVCPAVWDECRGGQAGNTEAVLLLLSNTLRSNPSSTYY